jgi:hypothetical protein
MTKNQKIVTGVGVITVIAIIAGGIWIVSVSKTSNKTANVNVAAITTFDQCVEAGFAIMESYPEQCRTSDGRIFVNEKPPAQSELDKAEQAIRAFMGELNLEFVYKGQNNHPDNFAVLSNIKQNEGGFTADNPEEWDIPVYIFEQKDYINDRCEVYRYQVTQKTNQVVEIGIVYPEEIQQGNPTEQQERKKQCSNYGSLEIPLKTKAEIEQTAFAYLGRDPEHTKFTLRSDIQPEYISSKSGAANPAMNEWKWEDKGYKLPEGLTGDPSPYPTMRIIISSGGKLVYYLNTTDLFEKN